jgi:transcriptional regulator with XRE-family HTH domain
MFCHFPFSFQLKSLSNKKEISEKRFCANLASMYKIKRNDKATLCFYLPYSRSILAKTKNKALLSTKFGAMSTTFGKRIRECREAKKWSQAALAREMSVHHSLIGKYERDEVKPSIDIGQRLATVLGTTVGYLLGETTDGDVLKDPAMLRRLIDINELPEEEKNHVLFNLDAVLRDFKTRRAYAS